MNLQDVKDWFYSEEGQRHVAAYCEKIIKEEEIVIKQLEKLNKSGRFKEFTEKVIEKYNSQQYKNRWRNRGPEPPETLFWFLFEYAQVYGRECNVDEWNKHANMFTAELYFCEGYYFNLMNGQGSTIIVTKNK